MHKYNDKKHAKANYQACFICIIQRHLKHQSTGFQKTDSSYHLYFSEEPFRRAVHALTLQKTETQTNSKNDENLRKTFARLRNGSRGDRTGRRPAGRSVGRGLPAGRRPDRTADPRREDLVHARLLLVLLLRRARERHALHLSLRRHAGRAHARQPVRPDDGPPAGAFDGLSVPDLPRSDLQPVAGLSLCRSRRRRVPRRRHRSPAGSGHEHLPQLAERTQFRIHGRRSAARLGDGRRVCEGHAVDGNRGVSETLHLQRDGILPPPLELDRRRTGAARTLPAAVQGRHRRWRGLRDDLLQPPQRRVGRAERRPDPAHPARRAGIPGLRDERLVVGERHGEGGQERPERRDAGPQGVLRRGARAAQGGPHHRKGY